MAKRKAERDKEIKRIISEEPIHDQLMLQDRLRSIGIEATQATLSRDLRLMGIKKKRGPRSHRAYYQFPETDSRQTNTVSSSPKRIVVPASKFMRSEVAEEKLPSSVEKSKLLKKMTISGPYVVLTTEPGYAQLVAREIDQLRSSTIVATIAGFDTILLIPSETATRETLRVTLAILFPELT